jgi:type VI secretion system protein ImpF
MPVLRGDAPVTLSLLDRLIDEDLKRSGEVHLTRSQSVRKLRDAVRRDLEWLLNTRQPLVPAADSSELQDSLYMYGLPDITSLSVANIKDRQRLAQAIQAAVIKFEPRIANPRVNLVTTGDEKVPALRFAIEGMLRIDPNPEHVSFDTVLELSSGEYKVQGETRAR